MRLFPAALVVLAACAARQPPPRLPVPPPEPGRLSVRAAASAGLGKVRPIAVAVTNGGTEPLRLDAQQIYAYGEGAERVAALTPAEAAHQAGGRSAPGALKGGAVGAASGGVFGAIGGAISGAIRGGVGSAVAAGTAVGATIGAIGGVITGSRGSPADVAGFQERALASTTLLQGFSASGYLYYPAGTYAWLELLLAEDGTGTVRHERVAIEPEE
jgi:hypothetical protein